MESVIDNAVVLSQFDPFPRVSISEARAEALRTATDEVEEEDLGILVSTRSWEIEEQKEIESDGIASKGATDEGQEDEVCNYEETVIHGMSLSDDGFCVLLKGVVCERILRVLITPSDYMADGLDRDQVDTPEAITLLQLLQGYICIFFLFVWSFFFTYALLAAVYVSHVKNRFLNTPRL
jgi:hypothetical protein